MATQSTVHQDPNEEGNQGSMYPGKGHQAKPPGQWQGGEAYYRRRYYRNSEHICSELR